MTFTTHGGKITLVCAIAVLCMAGVFFLPPIPQDVHYHNFADARSWHGIPNFSNVASNIPFVFVGLFGMLRAWRLKSSLDGYVAWMVFFAGVLLTGFGSAYYHLAPSNGTLVWDRLPMTVAFMALLSQLITDRMDERAGILLLPVLVGAGILSVLYWQWTESVGHGDLRPYVFVQFFPLLAMPLILYLFPSEHEGVALLVYAFLWYMVAKLLEHFDAQVFAMTGSASGHMLKHLAAAAGAACVAGYMTRVSNQNGGGG